MRQPNIPSCASAIRTGDGRKRALVGSGAITWGHKYHLEADIRLSVIISELPTIRPQLWKVAVSARRHCHEGISAVPEVAAGAVRYLIKITSFWASL
jgi:hypothetical protein